MNNTESTTAPAQAPLSTSKWLTAKEAATYLQVQQRTILAWVRQGKLKGYALSGCQRKTWRFLRVDLDATLIAPAVTSAKLEDA